MSSNIKKAERTFFAVWAACFVLGLAFWVGVIYVILHFIAKVW